MKLAAIFALLAIIMGTTLGFSQGIGAGAAPAAPRRRQCACSPTSQCGGRGPAGDRGTARSVQVSGWYADEVQGVQTLTQVNGEATHWFTEDFGSNFIGRTYNLPFDAHSIIALVAPRAIIVQEGTTDSWNNNANSGPFQSAWGAKKMFDYLDIPDNIGWVTDPHGHGQMTVRETAAVMDFVDRFLLEKKAVSTKHFDDDPKAPTISWKAPETK
jgi:hypothetical protein